VKATRSAEAISNVAASDVAPSSTRYAVYVLVLLLAANTLSYADRHLFAILIPAIKSDFGATDGMLGLIAGPGFIVSFVLFTIPLARLADHWSRRKVLAIAAVTWSVATALCGLATGMATLATARLVVGIGEAGGMPPSQSMIAQLFSLRRRATALGALAASTYFGLVLGLAGGGAIAGAWGWRTAFLLLALPGIPLALLVWLTGPRRMPRAPDVAKPADESMVAALRACWAIPSLRLLGVGMGIFNIFGYAGAIWMPAYFMRSHGMTMVQAGAWLGFGAAVGGIIGSFASGAIVDALSRHDERWQLRVPALGLMLAFPLLIVMLLLPGGASVTLLGHIVPTVALISLVAGSLSSLWMGPSFAAAARVVAPDRRAQATAMLVVIINVLGSACGPLVAGFVSDALTTRFADEALRYSLLAMSVLALVGGLIFWRAATHYPRDLTRVCDQPIHSQ